MVHSDGIPAHAQPDFLLQVCATIHETFVAHCHASLLINLPTSREIDAGVSFLVDMPLADHRARVVRMQTEVRDRDVHGPSTCPIPCSRARHQPIAEATPLPRWVILLVKCQRSSIRYDESSPVGIYIPSKQCKSITLTAVWPPSGRHHIMLCSGTFLGVTSTRGHAGDEAPRAARTWGPARF